MVSIELSCGNFRFSGHLLPELAHETCKWFLSRLPFTVTMVQAAWSGMAVFADLENAAKHVPLENATSYPVKSAVLLYPGNAQGNAGEIYIPYGGNRFACPIGQIAGSHFLTIDESVQLLPEFGRFIRYKGAQEVTFKRA